MLRLILLAAAVAFLANCAVATDCYVSFTPYTNASCEQKASQVNGCMTAMAISGECKPLEGGRSAILNCEAKNGTFYASDDCADETAVVFADQQCVQVLALGVYLKVQWDVDCYGNAFDGVGASGHSGSEEAVVVVGDGDEVTDSSAVSLSSSWWLMH
ncbi:hypothetical protein QOT17_017520 [Balamuthia mandrillaris]